MVFCICSDAYNSQHLQICVIDSSRKPEFSSKKRNDGTFEHRHIYTQLDIEYHICDQRCAEFNSSIRIEAREERKKEKK